MKPNSVYAHLKGQNDFWIYIWLSLGVHALLIGLLVGGSILKERGSGFHERTKLTALLRKGVEKPKNWLPNKLPAPSPAVPQNMRAEKAPEQSQKEPRPAQPNPAESRQDFSKAMANALANLTQEGGRTSKEEAEGSPDGVAEGTALIAELGNAYATQVYLGIKANYSVPKIITPQERLFLSATVVLYLDSRGNVTKLEFEKRSGKVVFDSAVESAIRKAAPFPPPPKELVSKYASEGIGLEFLANKL